MNKKIAKKIVAVAMIVSCLAGMAFGTNAVTFTVGANGTPKYYGSCSSMSTSIRRFRTYMRAASFSGLPSGTWPAGKKITFRVYNSSNGASSGPSTHSGTYSYGTYASFTPSSTQTYRPGGFTDYSSSATVDFTPYYYTT